MTYRNQEAYRNHCDQNEDVLGRSRIRLEFGTEILSWEFLSNPQTNERMPQFFIDKK